MNLKVGILFVMALLIELALIALFAGVVGFCLFGSLNDTSQEAREAGKTLGLLVSVLILVCIVFTHNDNGIIYLSKYPIVGHRDNKFYLFKGGLN